MHIHRQYALSLMNPTDTYPVHGSRPSLNSLLVHEAPELKTSELSAIHSRTNGIEIVTFTSSNEISMGTDTVIAVMFFGTMIGHSPNSTINLEPKFVTIVKLDAEELAAWWEGQEPPPGPPLPYTFMGPINSAIN